MSVGNIGLYRRDGRIRGSFVYMLVCRDENGPVYIKVGITDDLYQRLLALRCGCPVTPRYFHSFEVPSRQKAILIERGLHVALKAWKTHGEWFRVTMAQKAEFNAAHGAVIAAHKTAAWPCKWDKIAVPPLIADGQRRSRCMQQVVRRRGASYRDFKRDLQSSR